MTENKRFEIIKDCNNMAVLIDNTNILSSIPLMPYYNLTDEDREKLNKWLEYLNGEK